MQITRHTDYSLRLLVYLCLQEQGHLVTINEVAGNLDISRNHLAKVVNKLGQHGFVETVRGNHGGIRLLVPSAEIILGQVVRTMEMNMDIVDCEKNHCPITGNCRLKSILDEAKQAFLAVLDNYSLADLIRQPRIMKQLLNVSA